MPVQQLTATELQGMIQQGDALFLLDVREPYEYRLAHIAGSFLIPMAQIPVRLKELPTAQALVVICHHGIRSRQVAEHLAGHGFTSVYNLDGGIDAWSSEVDASVPRY
ncbi:MAG: rhodanese-like domain-containing protein [Gammaproteobacteria bacterium]